MSSICEPYVRAALLHSNDECVTGGDSVVTDVLAVVEKMRVTHPHHFATLVRVPATYHRIHSDRCPLSLCKNVTLASLIMAMTCDGALLLYVSQATLIRSA